MELLLLLLLLFLLLFLIQLLPQLLNLLLPSLSEYFKHLRSDIVYKNESLARHGHDLQAYDKLVKIGGLPKRLDRLIEEVGSLHLLLLLLLGGTSSAEPLRPGTLLRLPAPPLPARHVGLHGHCSRC